MNRKRIFSAVVAFLLSVTLIFGTQVNSASAADGGSVPIGTITAYAGSIKNDKGKLGTQGWLVCDGQKVNRTDYPELFEIIGTLHGGDPTKTFMLPDLRGRFVRGVDDGIGRDPDAKSRTASAPGGNTGDNVGSVQEDRMQGHTHKDTGHEHESWHYFGKSEAEGNGAEYTDSSNRGNKRSNSNKGYAQLGGPVELSYGSPRYGNETRPKNIYLNYIIKAK
ncbi:tail fiber protein [Nostoc sp.]|uniref:tail fiber protein n=1 Tax=Nostoc sp. TaxID=1180 RepID=UPI002FF96ADF